MTIKSFELYSPITCNQTSIQASPYKGHAYTLDRPLKKNYLPTSALHQAKILFNREGVDLNEIKSLPDSNKGITTLGRRFSKRFSHFTTDSVEQHKPHHSMEQPSQDSSNWTKTLGRTVKNITNTITLDRPLKKNSLNYEEVDLNGIKSLPDSNNGITTLGRRFSKRFSHFTIGSVELYNPNDQKPNNHSIEQASQDSGNWTKTLRRGLKKVTNTILISTKNPTKISKSLEKAKKFFQDSEYKKAKEEFKN